MKAIRTRYSGPTNTRGARIHATDSDGNRVSISFPYELDHEDAHQLAAYLLMRKMGWKCQLNGGGFGHDEYWTMISPTVPFTTKPYYETFFEREDRKVYAQL
jgi:hypothetical protein